MNEVKPADDVGEVSMLFGFPFRNERENGRVNHLREREGKMKENKFHFFLFVPSQFERESSPTQMFGE